MYAEWNESVCAICVPNCMNIDYNTGGGTIVIYTLLFFMPIV